MLLSLTQQVALSLENVRLVQASQERATQLQALTDVSADLTSSLKSSQLVTGLLDGLHNVLTYDTAILWLREGERMSVAAARGFPDNEERVGLTVTISDSALLAEMNRTSQGIVVGDVRVRCPFPGPGGGRAALLAGYSAGFQRRGGRCDCARENRSLISSPSNWFNW